MRALFFDERYRFSASISLRDTDGARNLRSVNRNLGFDNGSYLNPRVNEKSIADGI